MNTLEVGIIGSHAVVLQTGDGVHSLLRHILLCQRDGHLLGTVVTEVDEDHYIALFNATVHTGIVDRLDELIGNAVIIALLHGLNHICGLLTSTIYNQVVTFFHTLPALVAVHSVETTHDRGNGCIIVGTNLTYLLNETLTRVGVGITAVHVAVYEQLVLQAICLTNLDELEKMIEAGVNTTIRGKTHQVQFLVVLLGVGIGSLHLRVLHDGAVFAGAVDLYQVLIYDATGTDIEVTYFRVSHLTVGQTHVFTTGHQL